MTASKLFAPPIRIYKTSKYDPEENQSNLVQIISRLKEAKFYLNESAWDHSVSPTM